MNKVIIQFGTWENGSCLFFASWSDNNIVEYEIEDKINDKYIKFHLDEKISNSFIALVKEIDFVKISSTFNDVIAMGEDYYVLSIVQNAEIHNIMWDESCNPEITKTTNKLISFCKSLI